jgi:imidazolonepropionase
MITDGVVGYAGPQASAPDQGSAARIDCEGRAVIPGFVDAHTHLVFAGDRSDEFAMKMRGASYAELAKQGGGILSTVTATRAADEDALFDAAAGRLRRMIDSGTLRSSPDTGWTSTPS